MHVLFFSEFISWIYQPVVICTQQLIGVNVLSSNLRVNISSGIQVHSDDISEIGRNASLGFHFQPPSNLGQVKLSNLIKQQSLAYTFLQTSLDIRTTKHFTREEFYSINFGVLLQINYYVTIILLTFISSNYVKVIFISIKVL